MPKKLKEFTVSRKRWIRGEDADDGMNDSCLYRASDKKMCCLGFLARSSGAKVENIFGVMDPAESDCDSFSWPEGILDTEYEDEYRNSLITEKLMAANDDSTLTSREREKMLRELFKAIGIKVKFVP